MKFLLNVCRASKGFPEYTGVVLFLSGLIWSSCHLGSKGMETSVIVKQKDDFQVVGAMKNVMWKGELAGIISLDTIHERRGLYGLGPVEYLSGEFFFPGFLK